MNRSRSALALTLGVVFLATLGRAVAQAPPNGINVNVLNTPLPVTGSLGVSGTVNAAQSGAWNFFLNNTATNPVPVRDVENPARQAFTNGANCNLADGQEICNLFFAVPASKRLVIETVTVTAVVPAGQSPLVTFSALVNGTGEAFRLAVTRQGTFSGDDVFVGTHSTRFYADSGNSAVQGGVLRNATAGTGQLQIRVSGYLVNCGAGSGCPIP